MKNLDVIKLIMESLIFLNNFLAAPAPPFSRQPVKQSHDRKKYDGKQNGIYHLGNDDIHQIIPDMESPPQ